MPILPSLPPPHLHDEGQRRALEQQAQLGWRRLAAGVAEHAAALGQDVVHVGHHAARVPGGADAVGWEGGVGWRSGCVSHALLPVPGAARARVSRALDQLQGHNSHMSLSHVLCFSYSGLVSRCLQLISLGSALSLPSNPKLLRRLTGHLGTLMHRCLVRQTQHACALSHNPLTLPPSHSTQPPPASPKCFLPWAPATPHVHACPPDRLKVNTSSLLPCPTVFEPLCTRQQHGLGSVRCPKLHVPT